MQIRLAELLAAISLATDLGRGFPQEKALRTCLVAERVAEALHLDERARSDTYHAALIHPVGCTAFTYEEARLFGTSELVGVPAFARADAARPGEAIRAIRESVKGQPAGRRLRATVRNLTAGNKFWAYAVRADCEAGARFTRRIGLGDSVARIVVQLQERWDGKGLPAGLGGEEIEIGARVIALANQVEIFHRTGGPEEAHAMVRRRAGGWFDPSAAKAFEGRADDIFAELLAGSVWDTVLQAEPAPPVTIPEWRVDDVVTALANAVDLKSPYLLGHSSGVARLAEEAATRLGLGDDQPADRLRVGAGPPARLPHRADPGPVTPAGALRADRRDAPRARGRQRLPSRRDGGGDPDRRARPGSRGRLSGTHRDAAPPPGLRTGSGGQAG
jgi:hypothetical protein